MNGNARLKKIIEILEERLAWSLWWCKNVEENVNRMKNIKIKAIKTNSAEATDIQIIDAETIVKNYNIQDIGEENPAPCLSASPGLVQPLDGIFFALYSVKIYPGQ